jgi:outer membrane autotransporter protein
MKNEFKTHDFQAFGQNGPHAKYDVKSNYYGLSFGGGRVFNLGADNAVDVYGRYVWTRQAGDSARLSRFNERLKFDDVDSHRLRVGARYSASWSGNNHFYAGAAWEHEFDGEANAKINGRKIDSPDMKGSTGIAEVGLVLTPTGNENLSIDLGIQGYGGKRQGATGSAQLRYAF